MTRFRLSALLRGIALLIGLLATSLLARADTINLGYLSYDLLIPPDNGVPGTNAFTLFNLTGDPLTSGFALPPDFPVYSFLDFVGVSLTVTTGGSPAVIPLGDIGPGPFSSPSLEFPDTTLFSLASLTASLRQSTFLLSDGSLFTADSPDIVLDLLPSSGPDLIAGTDLAVISVNGSITEVPEPAGLAWLTALAAGLIILIRKRCGAGLRPAHPHSGPAGERRLPWLCRGCQTSVPLRGKASATEAPVGDPRHSGPAPLLLFLLAAASSPAQTPVTLTPAASPTAGQAGVTSINLTGSGFPAGTILPAATDVKLEPAAGGTAVTTKATAVVTVVGATRRVTFLIPATISVAAPTAYLVSVSGVTSGGTAFASTNKAALTINPPARLSSLNPNSGQAGPAVAVAITGVFTNFVQGATQANFGAGISVGGATEGAFGPVTVTGATTATAQLTINAAAAAGPRDVTVRTGLQQATLTAGFSVTTGGNPSITDFTPKSAPAGTLITVTGANLSPNPKVTLAKQGGGTIDAPVASAASGSLAFTIPTGAATGPLAVTVNAKSAASAVPLTIVASKDFTLSALPGTADLIQGQSVSFAVRLSSANAFGQLASLGVTGVPSGITAAFKPQSITAGQTSVLTLTAPAGQTLGATDLTLSAAAAVDGLALSQIALARVNVVAPTTTFMGRTVVDDPLQTPLAGVTVTMLGKDGNGGTTACAGTAVSDAAGNFALRNLPANCTGRQLVGFDGLTATSPPGKYAGVNLVYTLVSGQVTVSPVLVHLPRIDNKETFTVQQNSPNDQSYSWKSIPGLSVTVYRGTTFTMPDGSQPNPFPLVGVQVPIDRLPDAKPPVPTMLNVFIVAFQPANARASQPVAVYYPNVINTKSGTSMTLMTLDPTRGQMVPYGSGVVSPDGSQIVPDLDPAFPGKRYGIVNFDWHGPMPPPAPPGDDPPTDPPCTQCPCPQTTTPQPVNLSSGIETYRKTDISFGGFRGTVSIIRSYRTLSNNSGPFGIGGNHNYGYSLDSLTPQTSPVVNLITPEWNRLRFSRQADGALRNTTDPAMLGATMYTSSDGGTRLRWKDGTVYYFGPAKTGFPASFFPQLESITDSNGNAILLTRNPSRWIQITAITDPVGRSLTLTYDASDRVTSVTDPIGRVVAYTYHTVTPGNGALATVTDPEACVTRYEYEAPNRLTRETDPRNVVVVENTYDANGRVIQQKYPDGGIYKMDYALLNPTAAKSPVIKTVVTEPLGQQTTFRFNPTGYVTDSIDAFAQGRVFQRKAGTNLIGAVTGTGTCVSCGSASAGDVLYSYDDMTGNIISQTDALGRTTRYTYESNFSKTATITDPLGNVTRFNYDARGNLVSRTDPNNRTTTYTYDLFGQLTETTDPLGNKTKSTFDGFGNLVTVTDALGNQTRFLYDGISRQTEVIDALGRRSATAYDKFGRVVKRNDAKGGVTQFTYDGVGNLLSVKDARGKTTTFTYDGMSRLLTRTTPLNKTDVRSYDLKSNLVRFVDRRGQVSTFSYDAMDRLITETYQDSTVNRFYDATGRLVRVEDSAGGTFTSNYDSAGQPIVSGGPFGTIKYERDALGRVKTREVVGAPSVTYNYDPVGNLLNVAMPQASVAYTYDPRNLPQTTTRQNGVNTTSGYDSAGRLLSMFHGRGATQVAALNYTYNSAGQRVSQSTTVGQSLVTQPSIATYDDGNRLLTRAGSTFNHNDNGNLVSEVGNFGTVTYTWDSRNRLWSIVSATQTSHFIYDFTGNLLEQIDTGATNRTRTFVLDDLTNVAQFDGSPVLTGRSIDEHLAVVLSGSTVDYILTDAINSTVATLDQSGVSRGHLLYEPFGNVTLIGAAAAQPFQFTGRVPTMNAALYYYRARYYSPILGRFISEDPLGFSSGVDFYAYVRNDPVAKVDPFGLVTCHFYRGNRTLTCWAADGSDVYVSTNASSGAGSCADSELNFARAWKIMVLFRQALTRWASLETHRRNIKGQESLSIRCQERVPTVVERSRFTLREHQQDALFSRSKITCDSYRSTPTRAPGYLSSTSLWEKGSKTSGETALELIPDFRVRLPGNLAGLVANIVNKLISARNLTCLFRRCISRLDASHEGDLS